jgi:hypothetical protein
MSGFRLSGALVLLLPLLSLAAAQEEAGRPKPPSPSQLFQKARGVPEAAPEAFEFELSGYSYRVAKNGAGRRWKGDKTRRFNLRLAGLDFIKRAYVAEYDANVVLVCEVTDGRRVAGFVARLEQPSMRARWRQEIPDGNVGPPLREDQYLYLTAAGFVAKLDLGTGAYVWRNDNLYERGGGDDTFNVFALPELTGGAVLFRDVPLYSPRPTTVRVHKKTGKIISVE